MIKIIASILLLTSLIGCKKVSNKTKIKEKPAEIEKIEGLQLEENKSSVLEFKSIDSIIISTFKIKNTELEDVHIRRKITFYQLLDSTKIERFIKRLTFTIIEFDNIETSKNQFKNIKDVAKKGINDRKELYEYMGFFGKGGTSFNQIDKWIIIHSLRCNMNLSDHELDRQFTVELMNLNNDVDWVRNYCGWSKFEIK